MSNGLSSAHVERSAPQTSIDPGSLNVRACTEHDLPVVRTLFSAYHRWLDLDLSYQGYEREFATLPGDYTALKRGALFVAVALSTSGADEYVLGCVALRALRKEGGEKEGWCEIKRLYVVPDARALGVGRALVEAVLRQAKALRYQTCVLDTLPRMKGAIGLYKSFGFEETAKYYETPLRDTIFLRKTL